MNLRDAVTAILHSPSPAGLYTLGAALRECRLRAPAEEQPALRIALDMAGAFYHFLSAIQAKTTAEEYNKLASWLDLGSVGTVALQNVLAEREDRLRRLLMGGLSESLMLIGSLQYIKAWERETQALHEQAAWQLYGGLWELSLLGQPELPPEERRQSIENVLAPCFDTNLPSIHKTVYIGWLFQLTLLIALARYL